MKLLSIDPGPKASAYVVWDGKKINGFEKIENESLLIKIKNELNEIDECVIERVACYGMPVGESIFDTVYWTGIFSEALNNLNISTVRLTRKDVKIYLCNSMRAKDSNIIQALVDRFARYEKNKGKGTKSDRGFFYGFSGDVWQAFALAVTYFDLNCKKNDGWGV